MRLSHHTLTKSGNYTRLESVHAPAPVGALSACKHEELLIGYNRERNS